MFKNIKQEFRLSRSHEEKLLRYKTLSNYLGFDEVKTQYPF